MARRELAATGVETLLIESDEATAVKYLIVDENGDVAVLGYDGANEAFNASDLPAETLAEADHLHLTGQNPTTAATLARDAAAADVPVSFDPGRRLPYRDYSSVLSHAEILSCNDREADHARDSGLFETLRRWVAGDCVGRITSATKRSRTLGIDSNPWIRGRGRRVRCRVSARQRTGTDPERALAVANAVAHSQRSHPAHGRHSTGSPCGSLSTAVNRPNGLMRPYLLDEPLELLAVLGFGPSGGKA